MPLSRAPCGLRGCKNGPAPFPGRMSYKVTKPGLVFVLYLSMFFIVLLFIRAPLCRWPSITEWEMYITAQGCRLRNYLYCVEWDVKLYYTIPYHTIPLQFTVNENESERGFYNAGFYTCVHGYRQFNDECLSSVIDKALYEKKIWHSDK